MQDGQYDSDVIVIGGGPGGSTVATLLARAGHRVTVYERETFPRFRIGESMLPMVREIYGRLGVDAEMDRTFIRKYGAHFINNDGSQEFTYEFKDALDCPYAYAYHVKRDEHDAILLENARRAGARVEQGVEIDEVLFEEGRAYGVRVRAAAGSRDDGGNGNASESAIRRARFIVDASGRWSVLSRQLKLRKPDPVLNKAAVFSHYRGVTRLPGEHEGTITIATFEGGWIWIIPFKGEITSVGVVMHHAYSKTNKGKPEEMLDRALASSPAVMRRLANAERVMPAHAEGSFSYRSDRFSGPGWVLCGDAAAFLDPVFSSGVLLSMRCGEEIAARLDQALQEGTFDPALFREYERKMRSGMKTFWRFIYGFYDTAFINLFFTPTNRFQLRNAISGVLAGNIFPSFRFKLRVWTFATIVAISRFVHRAKGTPLPNRANA